MSVLVRVIQLILLLLSVSYGTSEGSCVHSGDGSSNCSTTSTPTNSRSTSSRNTFTSYLVNNSPPDGRSTATTTERGESSSPYYEDPHAPQLGDTILQYRGPPEHAFYAERVTLTTNAMLRKLNIRALDSTYFSEQTPNNPLRNRAFLHYPLTKTPGYVRKFVRRFMREKFRNQRSLHRHTASSLKNYLTHYSACPVNYKWHDFGSKYWPRWVRLGACFNRKPSCSIPPGMRCRPDRERRLRVLRYMCPLSWQRVSCDWRQVTFKVLTSCSCSC